MIPSNFELKLGGDKSKPLVVRLTIGENVLMLGLAVVAVIFLGITKKRR